MAHSLSVWHDKGTWRWTAQYRGRHQHGESDDALDARLAAMTWLGLQDRPPVAEVLQGIDRIQQDWNLANARI